MCVRVKPVAVSVYTTSVKVPPTSTPTSFSAFSSAARALTSTRGDVRPPCTARLVLFGKERATLGATPLPLRACLFLATLLVALWVATT